MSNEEINIYCKACGACGEAGCCPPDKCLYGDAYINDLRRDLQEVINVKDNHEDSYQIVMDRYLFTQATPIHTVVYRADERSANKYIERMKSQSFKVENVTISKIRKYTLWEKNVD
jgi:hypothetical protein